MLRRCKYYYTGQPNGWSYKNAVNGGLTYGTAAYGIRQSLNSYLYGMLSQIDLCDVHDLSIKMHALDGTGEPLHSIPRSGYQHWWYQVRYLPADQRIHVRYLRFRG